MYVYVCMVFSLVLCLVGIVLSVIDINKYNFGLYLALLSILTFTISLACFVVRPTICRGPQCLVKMLTYRREELRRRSASTLCSAALRDAVPPASRTMKELLMNKPPDPQSSECQHSIVVTRVVPSPSINIFDEISTSSDVIEQQQQQQTKRIRFVDEIDMIREKAETRGRAWTVSSSSACRSEINEKHYRKIQRLILRKDPATLLHSTFPLSERGAPSPVNFKFERSSKKSFSTEEVVDLEAYCRSSTIADRMAYPVRKTSKVLPCNQNGDLKSSSSDKNTQNDKPKSLWHRSHTIVVKYVPVRNEWLLKSSSPTTSISKLNCTRKRSYSSASVFDKANNSKATIDGKSRKKLFNCPLLPLPSSISNSDPETLL